ncbi:MAG: TonB-dependent receptor [Bacteroidota bacterium]
MKKVDKRELTFLTSTRPTAKRIGSLSFPKKLFLLFVGVLFFTDQAFSQYKVYGKITGGKETLIGANVYLKSDINLQTTSDLNGDYVLENLKRGNQTIMVSYGGYEPYEVDIFVNEDTKLNIDIDRRLDLQELTVLATRASKSTPMTYTNITKEELEENNLGQDVPFLLKWTPSVVVTSDAGAGIGYTGLRIRGSDPTRINVTINGIPLNDSESQGVFWVDLPDFASSTEDIQIQRGVGTSTNGAGAFGASINLNTSKVHKEAYGQLSASVGSFNTIKNSVQFGSGLIKDHFTFDGRLSRIDSDGFIDRATSDLSSYYLSAAYVSNQTSVRFNTFSGHEITYQAWNGLPAQFLEDQPLIFDTAGIFLNNNDLRRYNPSGTEKLGDFDEPHDNEVDNYRQTHYQALINHQFNWALNFSGALHYTKGQGFFEQYKADEDFADYGLANPIIGNDTLTSTDLVRRRWLDNDFYGFTYALNYTPARYDFTLGGAWNIYQGGHFGEVIWAQFASDGDLGHRYYDNDATKTDFNIFGKVSTELVNGLQGYLDLQYRRVGYEFLGVNDDASQLEQEVRLNFFNPKAGLTLDLNNSNELYASFAVANREPNRNDYTEAPARNQPTHETLYNTELGYRQTFDRAMIGANAYWMQYQDQLVVTGQLNDVGAATRVNVDDSYRVGLELQGAAEIMDGFTIDFSATFSQNKIRNFTEFIDNWDYPFQDFDNTPAEELEPVQFQVEHENSDLAFSPNVIISGGFNYDVFDKNDKQQLSFGLSTKHVGSQFIDNTSNENTKLDAYTYSDFRIAYTLKTNWIEEIGLTLLFKNIFNVNYNAFAWTYRYRSAGYDARPFDPYARLENENIYNLTGFFPQAGRNFLLGVNLKF